MQSNILSNVCKKKDARTGRVSSWDHSGKNEDSFVILPGEEIEIADIEGPGAITHLWFVQTCSRVLGPNWETRDEDFYRKVLIKMYWDNQKHPSVLAPLGDFFCVGNSMVSNFQSLPFTVSVKPSQTLKYGGDAAMNCYLTMPFNKRLLLKIKVKTSTFNIFTLTMNFTETQWKIFFTFTRIGAEQKSQMDGVPTFK